MISILQLQFFRIKKSVTFWILFGLCFALPLLSTLFAVIVVTAFSIDPNSPIILEGFGEQTVSILETFPSISNDAAVLAVICSSVLLCSEFGGGTMRNIVLANKSRAQIYGAMSVTAALIGTIYFTANYLFTLTLNGAIWGFGTITSAQAANACFISYALGFVAILMTQSVVVMFLFCLRKTSSTMVLSFVIMMIVPAVVTTAVQTWVLVAQAQGASISEAMLGWIPLYNISLLDLTRPDGALIGKILLYELPLTALFYFLGWVALRKTDIK